MFAAVRICCGNPLALRYDSSLVKQIRPLETKERQVFDEVDLGFAKTGENTDPGLVGRFFSWLLGKIFGNASPDSVRTIQWAFIWVLVTGGVIIAVWLFRKSEFGSFLRGNTKQAGFNFTDIDEDISQLDFGEKIRKAREDQDFRLAIRWLYLKQLFLLNEKNRIVWQPHKTNMDYAAELSSTPLKQPFRELSRIYEYAWYGDYPITENIFLKAESEFIQFENQIHV